MLADELAPGASATPRGGRHPMLAQDLGDTHVGDLKAEHEGFALDPTISPARVLDNLA